MRFTRPSIFSTDWQVLNDTPEHNRRSADSRYMEAGPSDHSSYDDYVERGYEVQPNITPERSHVRSQSRMLLFQPRRTTTQTKIWLDQHYHDDIGPARDEDVEKGSIRSRSSSEGSCEDKEGIDEMQRNEDNQAPPMKGMPFLLRPIHMDTSIQNEENGKYGENGGRPWLRPEDQATEWLSLFYDLVVVAVLTVFSSTHELSSPSAIWIFLSYFTILAWLWTSQVHYDIRYQAEDVFHRCCKVLQIVVLVYIGAASGSWNPGLLGTVGDVQSRAYTKHEAAVESFETILIAFGCSRIIFAGQYMTMMWLGYQAKRNIRGHIWTTASLIISAALALVALKLPISSFAILKICLFYTALAIEGGAVWLQVLLSHHVQIDASRIGDKYGAFTLIILGEGFIALVRGFSKAITGLSVGSTATYLQVFLAIAIICLLWIFLFSSFRTASGPSQNKVLLWESLHFPLHYCLLLFLGAIVNVVIVLSFVNGIDIVAQEFVATIEAISNHTSLSPADEIAVENYLNRLPLAPSYDREFSILTQLASEGAPLVDPLISAYQYFSQIVVETSVSYGITVGEETLDNLERIYAINTSVSSNLTEQAFRIETARLLMIDIVEIPVDESMSGTLWLFPCAGGVLILIGLRQLAWNNSSQNGYVIHALQIIAGLGLGLLGLLDIGSKKVTLDGSDGLNHHLNPLYVLLQARLPLVMVLLVYGLVFIGGTLMGRCMGRRRRCRSPYDNRHK